MPQPDLCLKDKEQRIEVLIWRSETRYRNSCSWPAPLALVHNGIGKPKWSSLRTGRHYECFRQIGHHLLSMGGISWCRIHFSRKLHSSLLYRVRFIPCYTSLKVNVCDFIRLLKPRSFVNSPSWISGLRLISIYL